ncbi:MAG TPA: septation protein A [Afifellaceae bacterium]|nr:septation protein A [Afifellaceae bacterium]
MTVFERPPGDPERKELQPLLKLALELGPLGVFFFANARFGIFNATGAFMVAIAVSLGLSWILTRRLAVMPVVTGIVVLVFGTLTLLLEDDTFIKLKPTIVNTLFGVILLGGLAFGKSLLGYIFDSVFKLDEEGWRKLTFRWGLFFFVLAVLNEIVWRNFSTDFWVSFKVFGIMPITLLFTITQMPLIMSHSLEDPAGRDDSKDASDTKSAD